MVRSSAENRTSEPKIIIHKNGGIATLKALTMKFYKPV